MITYQDLVNVGDGEKERAEFVFNLIFEHKNSDAYNTAIVADKYAARQNVTINEYKNLLYTITGETTVDNFSANYKLPSNFLNRFVTQENQYLLGNGITWGKEDTAERLGKNFDIQMQKAGRAALLHAVSFPFWNYDHVEVFKLTEYCPLYDEEDGAMKAGVRFWQIDNFKPLRATLYELDGYTEYIWKTGTDYEILQPKRGYIARTRQNAVEGLQIYDYTNYPTFPIVPFWGNPERQSELIGIREGIDCYDLIKSGFANDIDDASLIYWTINNAGGMDDVDLVEFVNHMRRVKAAVVSDDGARAESHTIDVPYASREAILERLRSDLYEDYMALDTKNIADGAVTATQIEAAYEPLNEKADMYESCIHEFLDSFLAIVGIDDTATFTRSAVVNRQEEIQNIINSAEYLSNEYVTRKILTILGDIDKANEVLEQIVTENDTMPIMSQNEQTEEQEDVTEE